MLGFSVAFSWEHSYLIDSLPQDIKKALLRGDICAGYSRLSASGGGAEYEQEEGSMRGFVSPRLMNGGVEKG